MTSRFLVLSLFIMALTACSSAIPPVDPSSPGAGAANIAIHLQEKGDVGGAMDFYRRALRSEPTNYRALKGMAEMLTKWGSKKEAATYYEKATRLYPRVWQLHYDYGKLLIRLDQPQEARAEFEEALDCDGDDIKALTSLGVAYDYLGNHRRAQRAYRAVLDEEPENFATLNNLAYSYILSNRFDRAVALLEPIYKKPMATPAMRQNLALAYGLSGMDTDAQRVASIDLSKEKVEKNMNYYKKKRAELALNRAPYAELGTYATQAMAVARIKNMKREMRHVRGDFRPVVVPQLSAPGGTPRFAVRMMGCSRPDDVSRLCQTLARAGIPCTPRGKGAEE